MSDTSTFSSIIAIVKGLTPDELKQLAEALLDVANPDEQADSVTIGLGGDSTEVSFVLINVDKASVGEVLEGIGDDDEEDY